jgi:hypothetical protein
LDGLWRLGISLFYRFFSRSVALVSQKVKKALWLGVRFLACGHRLRLPLPAPAEQT